MIGNVAIKDQLAQLGYGSTDYSDAHGNNYVSFQYTIPLGRFRGETVEIALNAPQFPNVPPTGPYIKPHILPITGGGGTHPFGGIHDSKIPTLDFQYWSRPCNGLSDTDKHIKSYLAFLRSLFDFE